jgi:hypothetical protein
MSTLLSEAVHLSVERVFGKWGVQRARTVWRMLTQRRREEIEEAKEVEEAEEKEEAETHT